MKLQQLIIVLCLLNVINVVAQNDAEKIYSIETRCLPEPIQPNTNWTYSGTLLMSGYAGIHAMQAAWETPRIEALFSSGDLGTPHEGGQLSPNAQWYAVPLGDTWIEPSFNQYWVTYGLRIYSTNNETEINIDLHNYDYLLDYTRMDYYGLAWTYEAVRWIDDSSLIIGSFLVRPFGDEIEVEVATIPISLTIGIDFEVTSDWSRIYSYHDAAESREGIFDPEHSDELITSFQADGLAWKHNSSGFIADQQFNNNDSLSLFDKDGELIERLFVADGGRIEIRRYISGRNDLGWSPDDSQFAFVYYAYPHSLIILDLENKVAINTCLNPVSDPVWSPDGSQIAILLRATENLKVVIIDLESWTSYDAARHSGIGASLQPNMLAWRSN